MPVSIVTIDSRSARSAIRLSHANTGQAQAVPGLFFVGEKDAQWRVQSMLGIYACNRHEGVRWALGAERGIGHTTGESARLAQAFFRSLLTRPTADAWLATDTMDINCTK